MAPAVRGLLLALLLSLSLASALGRAIQLDDKIVMPTESEDEDNKGTRWAVLIAGSSGYWNYRHQVCMDISKILIPHLVMQIHSLTFLVFVTGRCMPCVPNSETRRLEGREYHRLHVR